MTDAVAACWDAPSFDAGNARRRDRLRFARFARLAGGAFVGLGTAGFVCLPLVVVATAGWLMATPHAGKPHFELRAPPGPMILAAAGPKSTAARHSPVASTVAKAAAQTEPPKTRKTARISFESRWADAFGPAPARRAVASVTRESAAAIESVPLPRAHPPSEAPADPTTEIARVPETAAAPKLASAVAIPAPPPVAAPISEPAPRPDAKSAPAAPVKEAHNRSIALPGRESRTAVYDISARTVYMPNGDKLEAHSGLGEKMDDPRYIRVKMRGPTPPNVYDLKLRERLFHGVRAIRLTPVDERKMFGRDGMLAHTYMLGPSGQSNGCISFKDYTRFLRAYLNGEITRLVVVPRLGDTPLSVARKGGDDSRYAAAEPPDSATPLTW